MRGVVASTSFEQRVARIVRGIPRGSTLSYGEVAAKAGSPRAARAVVSVLRRTVGLPWWRVIRADGSVAPQMEPEQSLRLRAEGVHPRGNR